MKELPRGWVQVRLDEIADVRLGRQRSPKNHFGPRMRPYLRAANVTWDGLDLRDVKEMSFAEEESTVYELHPGDVLVAEASGSPDEVGKAALWRDEIDGCCFQNTLIRVRSRGVLPEYLRYFLLGEARSGRIGRASPGVGIHHIGAARLAAWPVFVPPLGEQRQVVAAIEEHLSRLDAAERSLRRARDNLDRLRERALGEVLQGKWPVSALGALAQVITKGTTPTSIGFGFSEDGILFVKAESIVNGLIDPARCAHVSEEADQALSRSRLAEDDVLITIAGTLGRVGRVRAVDLPANTNQAVSLARLRDRSLARYLVTWLHGPVAQRYLKTAGRGVGLLNLNLKQIAETPVLLPPAAEQQRIVAEFERQVTLIQALRDSIANAQRRSAALRAAILARAFRGELVPQDPDDEPASALLERIAAERAAAPKPARRRRATMRPR